jgi:tRNA A37 threonylcarbamoyladenosine modification protein TsaB
LKNQEIGDLKKVLHKYIVLVISISSPLLIGVYKDGVLVEKIERREKTSDILLKLLMNIANRYDYREIVYTNGPGSYMAIKLSYIILRSLEILKDIKFYGCDAFSLNNQNPIKAVGKLYFIKEKETIITKKFDKAIEEQFRLPTLLDEVEILDSNKPLYILPAI